VTDIIDKNTFLAAFSSQSHYNDMDMLEVGRGMTAEEDKSHFSMWCILSAPLVLGNNLSTITQQTKNILTNAEVIAVNQDTTGVQGHLVSDNGAGLQVWAKNLNGKQSAERAVVLFNRSSAPASISVKWTDLNLEGSASVRDLWSHTNLGNMATMYTSAVPSHGVVMIKVVGNQTRLQEVFEAEYAWINNYNLTQNSAVIANQGRATVDPLCSGRAKAEYIGNRADNYMEFRDIYTNATGRYNLVISYMSGENRNATVSVNGIDTLLTNLNSGSFSTLKNITFSVKLNKGYNTIRIANATGWTPNVDKIQLDLNSGSATSTEMDNFSNLLMQVYPNPVKEFANVSFTLSQTKNIELSVFDMLGKVVKVVLKKQQLNPGEHTYPVDISSLDKGVYLCKLNVEGMVKITLLVKE